MLIPLSSIMFPHMSIMCFTARQVTAFKKTVVLYPLCIMLIWLPCVFLGAIAAGRPEVTAAMAGGSETLKDWAAHPTPLNEPALMKDLIKVPGGAAFRTEILKAGKPPLPREFSARLTAEKNGIVRQLKKAADPKSKALYGLLVKDARILASSNSDSVLLQMLKLNVWPVLAGILAAGIISAVMGSDCHQILALSTMFTKDIVEYYGGRERFGERGTVVVGRTFIVVANVLAFCIALFRPQIFELAVQYAFSGFAALAPVMIAALFWNRSTKYGALAAAVFVALCVTTMAILELHFRPQIVPAMLDTHLLDIASHWALFLNRAGQLRVFGWMPVVPMVIGSTLLMIAGSLASDPPSAATISRYFPSRGSRELTGASPIAAGIGQA